jgi:hypothetical protein
MLAVLLVGCGATTPPSEGASSPAIGSGAPVSQSADSTTESPSRASSSAVDDHAVPTECAASGSLCLPPAAFAKRLCGGAHPDVALAFFRGGSPFSRGFLSKNVDAWNASGGASSADKLAFDEEVIVVVERKNTTGIQVSGASGSYDVLRWDGTCATLSSEELTFQPPPKAKAAKIVWKYLPDATQAALLADEAIARLNKERRDECKGVTSGDVSVKCVKAVDKLSDAVVAFVRKGGAVPAPARID